MFKVMTMSFVGAAAVAGVAAIAPAPIGAQGGSVAAPPDFTGVYYPVAPFGVFAGGQRGNAQAAGRSQGLPPPLTRSAPIFDGS